MYQQIPTVITKVAAEGIPEIEDYCLIAEKAEEFAEGIIQIYNQKQLWNTYSENGNKLIRKYFTEKVANKIMNEIIMSSGKL